MAKIDIDTPHYVPKNIYPGKLLTGLFLDASCKMTMVRCECMTIIFLAMVTKTTTTTATKLVVGTGRRITTRVRLYDES
jgi:hypothetical protein